MCADAAGRLDRLTTAVTDKDAARAIEAGSDSRVAHLHAALAQQAAARGAATASSTAAGPLGKARSGLLDLTARTQLFLFETLFDAVRAALEGARLAEGRPAAPPPSSCLTLGRCGSARARAAAMPTLPQWAGPTSGGGAAPALPGVTDVPTFSLAPSAYVTVVGEHLLTLPQQMEPYTETSVWAVLCPNPSWGCARINHGAVPELIMGLPLIDVAAVAVGCGQALAFSLQTLPPQVASAGTRARSPNETFACGGGADMVSAVLETKTATGTGAPDGSDLTELWIRSVGKAAMAALVDRTLRVRRSAERDKGGGQGQGRGKGEAADRARCVLAAPMFLGRFPSWPKAGGSNS